MFKQKNPNNAALRTKMFKIIWGLQIWAKICKKSVLSKLQHSAPFSTNFIFEILTKIVTTFSKIILNTDIFAYCCQPIYLFTVHCLH